MTQVVPGYMRRIQLQQQQDGEQRQQQQQQRAMTGAMALEARASDACNKGLGYLFGAIQRAEAAQTMASGAEAKVGTFTAGFTSGRWSAIPGVQYQKAWQPLRCDAPEAVRKHRFGFNTTTRSFLFILFAIGQCAKISFQR